MYNLITRTLLSTPVALAVLAVGLAPLPLQAQEATPVEVPPEIRSLMTEWKEAYEARDAGRVAALYAEDGTHLTDWGAEVTGPEAIGALYETAFGLFASIELDVRFTDFQQAHDWAFGRVLIARSVELRDGRTGSAERHHAFAVKRTGEGWRLAWDLTGPTVEEPPPGF